jgi:hypothetical protein
MYKCISSPFSPAFVKPIAAYVDTKTKMIVADPKQVAARYFQGWLVVDLLSSIPIAALSLVEASVEDYFFFKIFRFLKLFRISRLTRSAGSPLYANALPSMQLDQYIYERMQYNECRFFLLLPGSNS